MNKVRVKFFLLLFAELSFEEQEKACTGKPLPAIPADPVSMSIAYKKLLQPLITHRQKTIQHGSEGKLGFGHIAEPKDGRKFVNAPDIPEEKLSNMDKPVVELKIQAPGKPGCASRQDDDDYEQLEALERARLRQEQERLEGERRASVASSSYISFR